MVKMPELFKHSSFWHTLAGILGKLGLLCLTYQLADQKANQALTIICMSFAGLGIIVEGFASWVGSLNIQPPVKEDTWTDTSKSDS
jgi:hypothetical protein